MEVSQEFLTAISEIAIGLIGFSGIVTVLGQRAQGAWSAEDFLQLRTQVEPSVVVLFGALLPGALDTIIEHPQLLWRACNALLALFTFVALTRYYLRARVAEELISQKILGVLTITAIIAMTSSALNFTEEHVFIFIVNLLLMLVVGVHNFMLQLFQIERRNV